MKHFLILGLAVLSTSAFAQSYDSSTEFENEMNNENIDAQEMQDHSSSANSKFKQKQSQEAGEFDRYQAKDAQNQEDNAAAAASATSSNQPLADKGGRHMFEFNIDSILAAAISFDKVKTKGQDSDNDTNMQFSGNYFYGVHPMLQIGGRVDYFNGVGAVEDIETMSLDIGGYINSDQDFSRAAFLGAFVGAGWAQQFGDTSSRDDLRQATVSIGKRFPLSRWGIRHITWTPELALKYQNSTTDQSLDYTQSLQLRILQFSVLF